MNESSEAVKLFKFPLNIIVIDNDVDYLNMLEEHLKHTTYSLFSSPVEAIKNINPLNINVKFFLEETFSGIKDLNYKNIQNFIKEAGKRQGIIIADYEMPEMNGIELLSKYDKSQELIRILLTNVVGFDDAVCALNKKYISYYLAKDRVSILPLVINEQEKMFFDNATSQISNFLETDSLEFLNNTDYKSIFNQIIDEYQIKTYYVINSYGHYYLEKDTDKFIFTVYHQNDLLEIANDVSEQYKNDVKDGDLIPSSVSDTGGEYSLIKANRVGEYSYCVEQIV